MTRTILVAATAWSLLVGVVHAQSFTIRVRAELEVRTPEGRTGPLPLVDERLRAEIDAQNATTELRQVFLNQTAGVLEGRYVLRTNLGARVTGFAYYIGEERIVGEVLERQAANNVYNDVTAVRRDPAILEQTAENEVTFRVFPIQPAERKPVEITFSEWLSRRGQTVTYRVPLGSPTADAVIIVRDPRARDLRSPTHQIDTEALPGGDVRVRARRAIDWHGELVLRYRIEEPHWALSAYIHRDPGQAGYFLLSLAAPPGMADSASAKDVTLILDRSGSMSGDPIAHARQAAIDVIRRLGPADRVNVVAFDSDVDPLYARPRAIDETVRADAIEFVGRLNAGGGTDIAFALRRGLEAQHDDSGGRPRVVILLTDGQSQPEPVLELASSDRRDVRVFTVGLGSGVNRPLLSRLAAEKRGTFTFIAQASQLEAEVGHLYAQIAQPLLVDLALDVEGEVVASRTYPRTLPDLFVDDELTVRGRIRGDGPVRFILRGRVGDRPVEISARAQVPARATRPWVGRRWAIARVDDLLEEIQLKGEQPETRDEVISLALAYDFITPYTAYLAIPERELTANARQMLDSARSQRMAAQAQHADGMISQSGGAQPMPIVSSSGGEDQGVYAAEEMSWSASQAGCASCTAVGHRRALPYSGAMLVLVIASWLFRRRLRR